MSRVFEGGVEVNTLIRGSGIDHRIAVRCATTSAITIATGLNPGDAIDGVTLVAGDRILVKNQSMSYETTSITTVADVAGSLGGKYFLLNAPSGGFYMWFDVNNTSTNPNATAAELINSGRTGIEVNISTGATAVNVADAIRTAIGLTTDFTLAAGDLGAGNNPVIIRCVVAGNVPNTTDGANAATGFSFSITNGGTSNVDHGIWICNATPYRAEDLIEGDSASHVFVHVEEGTINGQSAWVCKNIAGDDVVGTNALDWAQFALYSYTKGDLFVATSNNTLGKLVQPSNISLLQTDGSGNVSWTSRADVQAGFDPKESVRFATIAPIVGTYSSTGGPVGTGAFTSVDLTNAGDFDLDSNTVNVGDRILIKDQVDPKQNGIYVVTVAGATGTIIRAPDQDGSNPASELSSGNFVFVELGATLGQTGWITQGDGILAVNVDPINWVQFNGSFGLTDGKGITITGNKISTESDEVTVGTTIGGVASSGDAAVLSVISTATLGQVLRSTGTAGNAATWGALDLANTNSVTGALDETNGGTGQTTYVTGDTLYASAANTLSKLAFNDYSTYVAGASVPAWSTSIYATTILAPDATGEELLRFTDVASAVNEFTITNAATGTNPILSATGGDTNIGINLLTKGTGCVNVLGNATQGGCVAFFEDTDNGTNSVILNAPASITANRSWFLPLEDPAVSNGYILQTNSAGQWSFVNPAATTKRGYTLQTAEISVNNASPTWNAIAYFAWDESEYGDSSNPRLVFYTLNTSGGSGNRDVLVRILNSALTVIDGPTTFSTDGVQVMTITEPVADDYLIIQVQKSANGGTNPSIFGMQLEMN
jgi:hypothetical protein